MGFGEIFPEVMIFVAYSTMFCTMFGLITKDFIMQHIEFTDNDTFISGTTQTWRDPISLLIYAAPNIELPNYEIFMRASALQ